MKQKKIYSNSWAANLNEEQQWKLFYKSQRCTWEIAIEWAKNEFKLEKKPSHAAFFKWRKQMCKKEHAHSIAESIIAQNMARDTAKRYKITDEENIKSLMSAATNAALVHKDAKTANDLIEIAMKVRTAAAKDMEVKQGEERLKMRQQELDLLKKKVEMMEKREKETVEAVSNEKRSPEEIQKRVREIFGIVE